MIVVMRPLLERLTIPSAGECRVESDTKLGDKSEVYTPQKKVTNKSNSVEITPRQIEETIEAELIPTSLKVNWYKSKTVIKNGENKNPRVKDLKVVAYKKEILVYVLKRE